METIYECTVPLEPVTKKNSQQIVMNPKTHRPFIMPSAKYRKYEKDAGKFFMAFRIEPIDYPVNIRCHFYMRTRRRVDLTNLLEAIDDVMVRLGILTDDDSTVVVSHDGSRVFYDKENPRTEIEITKY